MQVLENRELARGIYALKLGGDFPYGQIRPGQFVHIKIGAGQEHPLRRPFSIASVDQEKRALQVVLRVVGAGTLWLSQRSLGDELDVLGPLGRGFPLPASGAKVLVVGGGVGIPPLFQLAKEMAGRNIKLQIVLGFKKKAEVFWQEQFSPWGPLLVSTEDGSFGKQGLVTEMIDPKGGWDYLYACGPQPMLKALKEQFSKTKTKGYVSLETRMACGVGACSGCAVPTADGQGMQLVCHDGPVFPWQEVLL